MRLFDRIRAAWQPYRLARQTRRVMTKWARTTADQFVTWGIFIEREDQIEDAFDTLESSLRVAEAQAMGDLFAEPVARDGPFERRLEHAD